MIPRKGILTLIRAFAAIQRSRPAATLAIVGEMTADPAYAAQCQALVAEWGLGERVRFLGPLSTADVAAQYAGCDIMLLASEQETAPVSIAEAMAVGRPVVATDVGGCASMVSDGTSGRIVPPRDPDALAQATLALLSDPRRCLAMGQAARLAACARFRLTAVVEKTVAVYQEIIQRGL